MEYRQDLRLLEESDQLAAIFIVTQLDIEHMCVLLALGRNRRQFNTSGASQRRQGIKIGLPQREALLINTIRRLQLRPQVGRLQIRHQIAGANIAPGIFIHLATEELAAIGALLTNNLSAFNQRPVVDQRRTAFAPGGVVFSFVEAKAADMADGSQRAPFIGRHHPLRGVLHHVQVMMLSDSHNGVHLTGHACIVDRHNGAGVLGDRRLDKPLINVHGVRADVDKDDFRSTQHKGVGGRDEGIAGHDHFVARLDIQQQGRHLQRGGTGGGQQHLGAAETLLHPLLAATRIAAVAAQLAAAHRRLHVIEFCTHNRGRVKRDHRVTCIASRRCFPRWHRSECNV